MAGGIDFEVRDLRAEADLRLLRQFYDEVLVPSFRADELDRLEAFERGLSTDREPRLGAAVAVEPGGRVVAGLTADRFTSAGVLLLGYLAVRPDLRGLGIGTHLMRTVGEAWYRDPAVVLTVGEVHDPRHDWDLPGEDALGRLRFYERVGALLLGIPFVQPSLGPGLGRVRNFLLVAFSVSERALVDADRVDSRRVAAFVRDYFAYSEERDPAGPDPELGETAGSGLLGPHPSWA